VLLWIHFLAAVLSLTTTYRYAASWSGLLMIFGFAYCPNYTRLGGFVGKYGMKLESLMNLCLSDDIATQEYAAEAVSELLTIPAIQDQFVELGGVRTLCALLHSKDKRVVNEAVTALSYIVADSEANRQTLLNENGMDDLFYIAERVHVPASRIVSAIFLELAFSAEIRIMMSAQQAS
ncbi:predicted protein, partial [Nematostella vectensis]